MLTENAPNRRYGDVELVVSLQVVAKMLSSVRLLGSRPQRERLSMWRCAPRVAYGPRRPANSRRSPGFATRLRHS